MLKFSTVTDEWEAKLTKFYLELLSEYITKSKNVNIRLLLESLIAFPSTNYKDVIF